MYRIGEFAKLTGVTERTLRYYDKKGLLGPSLRDASGYRHYSKQDLFRLQKILTMKYLNFTLEEIAEALAVDSLAFSDVLNQQHEWLIQKRKELDSIIDKLDYMKRLSSEGEQISAELIIMMIYSLQHEDKQKEYLLRHLPNKYVEAILLADKDKEERIKVEKQIAVLFSKLVELSKKDTSPYSEEAIDLGLQLYDALDQIVAEAMNNMTEEEKQLADQFDMETFEIDPTIFPEMLLEKEIQYLEQLMEHVKQIRSEAQKEELQ